MKFCDKTSFAYPLLWTRKHDWEENLEAFMDNEQSSHDCFLEYEISFFWEQALEQTPFNLCIAQLQLRWYGLRSISMSDIDMLPSKTHRSIASAAPAAILYTLFLPYESYVWAWECGWAELVEWMCWNFFMHLNCLYRAAFLCGIGKLCVIWCFPWNSRELWPRGFFPK